MLTDEQEKWLAHLDTDKQVVIAPFDPTAEEKFEQVKKRIQEKLGNVPVEHHGSSSLGIGGQDEIDIYIPVAAEDISSVVEALKALFGEPRSTYPDRVRFRGDEGGKKIDLFVINEGCEDWKNMLKFESVLESDPAKLEAYRKLKEESAGLSIQEYYRRKILFINEIFYGPAKSDTDQSGG